MPPEQSVLFSTTERARRRRTDPLTSFWAAEGIDVTHVQALILNALISGPATDDQLAERVNERERVTAQSVRSRRAELVAKGLIEWTGDYGVTKNGGKCRVWGRAL